MNSKEQDKILETYEGAIRNAQLQVDEERISRGQQELMSMEPGFQANSINEQLNLGEDLEKIHNLLLGYILEKDKDGITRWVEPKNNDLVILNNYGVSYVMQMLQAYLTKNTLLSNYDDKQIAQKMEDFSTTLVDDIFMEYDKMFLEPTLEECKDVIKKRIQDKVNLRMFAMELAGKKDIDEDEIEEEFLKEIEGRVEKELEIIKQQKMKNKLKRFESIVRMIQDTVHSAYQRAWKGQERTTARSHMHVSETKGGMMMMPQQGSGFNPFGILGRK